MTLTRAEIAKCIQEKLGYSKPRSVEFLEIIIESITSTLENDEDVLISGFGKFNVCQKNERRGRNPATDERMMIRERKIVTFKCSGKLKKRMNGDGGKR